MGMKHLYGWTIESLHLLGSVVYIKAKHYSGNVGHWERKAKKTYFSWNGEMYKLASMNNGETSFKKA
jgi:hypothetical protein